MTIDIEQAAVVNTKSLRKTLLLHLVDLEIFKVFGKRLN